MITHTPSKAQEVTIQCFAASASTKNLPTFLPTDYISFCPTRLSNDSRAAEDIRVVLYFIVLSKARGPGNKRLLRIR